MNHTCTDSFPLSVCPASIFFTFSLQSVFINVYFIYRLFSQYVGELVLSVIVIVFFFFPPLSLLGNTPAVLGEDGEHHVWHPQSL